MNDPQRDSMNLANLKIFVMEAEQQARYSHLAAADLEQALSARDIERVFLAIQAFLGSSANLSRLFWPPRPSKLDRGTVLRQLFGLHYSSPLRSRELRDHFEHFDERIEAWYLRSPRRNYVDRTIAPPGAIKGIDPGDYQRILDPTTYTVSFWGQPYPLRPLIAECERVHAIATLPWGELARRSGLA